MVKIGIVQMKTSENKDLNISTAKEGIEQVVKKGAQIVILPEIFNAPYDTKKFREYSEEKNGKTWTFLSTMAKNNKIYLIGGSIPERENDKIYNTSFIFDSNGNQISRHRKMHLFDIDIKGGQSFKESESLTPGNSICVFNTSFCSIGVCICFDMRFPELSRLMALKGAQIIIVPAAFNMTTGPPHWESMFKQRAIDNQCFTIGVAPARDEKASYISYANSIIVNPWGKIIYRANEKECYDVIDIDLSEINSIRQQLPLLSARRNDIYTIKENDESKEKEGIVLANESNAYEIYYILSKAKEKLNKKGIEQWKEGWDINDIKKKCKLGLFYVFYDKGNIIGCYSIEKNANIEWIENKEKEYSYLSLLCLHPDYQGKGLGKVLLQSAFENSNKIIFLDCWAGNNKLKKFYESNGFKYIKETKENDYFISIFKKE
jgi:predicted amidohydrolase/GNAT superfamily N-acetyltransferase